MKKVFRYISLYSIFLLIDVVIQLIDNDEAVLTWRRMVGPLLTVLSIILVDVTKVLYNKRQAKKLQGA